MSFWIQLIVSWLTVWGTCDKVIPRWVIFSSESLEGEPKSLHTAHQHQNSGGLSLPYADSTFVLAVHSAPPVGGGVAVAVWVHQGCWKKSHPQSWKCSQLPQGLIDLAASLHVFFLLIFGLSLCVHHFLCSYVSASSSSHPSLILTKSAFLHLPAFTCSSSALKLV